jgi:hypothetical protein
MIRLCEGSIHLVYDFLYVYGTLLERHSCTWFEIYTCDHGYEIYVIRSDWLRRLSIQFVGTGC